MKKSQVIKFCKKYGINPTALKEVMKKEGVKRKIASRQDMLEILYLFAPDLLWRRGAGYETVEYLHPKIAKKLVVSIGLSGEVV